MVGAVVEDEADLVVSGTLQDDGKVALAVYEVQGTLEWADRYVGAVHGSPMHLGKPIHQKLLTTSCGLKQMNPLARTLPGFLP